MLPYGIIIKQNRAAMQQSVSLWQKKYGILKPINFIKSSFPVILLFMPVYFAAEYLLSKEFNIYNFLYALLIDIVLICFFMYTTAMKTAREYAAAIKEQRMQFVLKEDVIEITTEFSKTVIPYDKIDYCFEKDFLVTLIFDKYDFPFSIPKTCIEKGSYDLFVNILKSKIPDRYVKKGEN